MWKKLLIFGNWGKRKTHILCSIFETFLKSEIIPKWKSNIYIKNVIYRMSSLCFLWRPTSGEESPPKSVYPYSIGKGRNQGQKRWSFWTSSSQKIKYHHRHEQPQNNSHRIAFAYDGIWPLFKSCKCVLWEELFSSSALREREMLLTIIIIIIPFI